MKNSIYEEKDFQRGLTDFHKEEVEKIGLPDWMKALRCPDCTTKIKQNGIREIKLCLNARNIGDIAVEYHCGKCGIMNTLYFHSEVQRMSIFNELLNNKRKPSSKPVSEEEMYKLGYNNLVERFLLNRKITNKEQKL